MALFLLKSHVTGPSGQVTSPDVIVDRLILNGSTIALHRLTHDAWQQCAEDTTARAAYALMALGGGDLILPVIVVDGGPIVAARCGWRLSALADHFDHVALNGVPLTDICVPSTLVASIAGPSQTLPRGHLLVQTKDGLAFDAVLEDHKIGRVLAHKVTVESLGSGRWSTNAYDNRYAVGPTKKEVQHYI